MKYKWKGKLLQAVQSKPSPVTSNTLCSGPSVLTYSALMKHVRVTKIGCNGFTHWGRVTHKCVGNQTIIDSDNGLSHSRRKAIIWTNARILLIRPLWTNFSEIVNPNIFIQENAFESVVCEMAAILSRPQCVKFVASRLLSATTLQEPLVVCWQLDRL